MFHHKEATSGETLMKPNNRMRYLERSTKTYSSIFSFYHDEIYMHQTKTSILYINTNHIHPYLACGLSHVPVSTTATRQQIRLIDNLDSGHVDNTSDIPRLSANEKAGVRGVVAENGRIINSQEPM